MDGFCGEKCLGIFVCIDTQRYLQDENLVGTWKELKNYMRKPPPDVFLTPRSIIIMLFFLLCDYVSWCSVWWGMRYNFDRSNINKGYHLTKNNCAPHKRYWILLQRFWLFIYRHILIGSKMVFCSLWFFDI